VKQSKLAAKRTKRNLKRKGKTYKAPTPQLSAQAQHAELYDQKLKQRISSEETLTL
tara:strand:+ start:1029 stop:1196 length:168 start_codon:yes stop_codon:yes gene_type:complete